MKAEKTDKRKPGRPPFGDDLNKYQRKKLLVIRGIIKPRCRAKPKTDEVTR